MAKIQASPETNIVHPYAPDVQWRIAVSRRFNVPYVDALYYSSIHPVLTEEGLVLECSNAREDTATADFWTNRMNLILECSEIHLLLDVNKSGNMEFEFEKSQRLLKLGKHTALMMTFGWNPRTLQVIFKPFAIMVTDADGKDLFSAHKRLGVLHLRGNGDEQDIAIRLHRYINLAKQEHLKTLRRNQAWFSRFNEFIGLPVDDAKRSLIVVTEMTNLFAQGRPMHEIEAFFDSQREAIGPMSGNKPLVLANEHNKWMTDIKQGRLTPPKTFKDTFIMVREHYLRLLFVHFGQELATVRLFRGIVLFVTFFVTIEIRRSVKRRQLRECRGRR